MKRLLLLRHAKSSWDHPELSDFERPLNDRGRRDAPMMGKYIAENGLLPDLIVHSPATRAATTAELAAAAAGASCEMVANKNIYEATAGSLLEVLAGIDDGIHTAMLVGHNPGMEDTVEELTGKFERMPTAALAVIDLDIDKWNKIGPGTGSLVSVTKPKKLKKSS